MMGITIVLRYLIAQIDLAFLEIDILVVKAFLYPRHCLTCKLLAPPLEITITLYADDCTVC